ncbi:MAG TPA: potassium channel family protein [Egicoccus sp.]|nr:potassium channel family protein [Egicoccus sp.]HSK24125.1 potassium channel family protein [Egicoccus sp.]
MNVWLVLLGGALLALAAYDVIVTTISTTSAGGPLTSRFGRAWWRVAHLAARRPTSRWLSSAGPVILLGTIGLWLLLMWSGWTLVFAADTSAVVSGTSQAPADWWSRVYYTGFTIFTLGVGDYVPAGAPWQVLTVLASASGLAVTTASITYLIPVVTAATQRAQLAARIEVMGGDAHALVANLYHDGSVAQFGALLPELTDRLLQTGERHLAYPILHYFHPRTVRTELRIQLAALDDAVTLVQSGLAPEVGRPHPATLRAARSAIAHLLERAHVADAGAAPPLELDPLRAAGVPVVSDAAFADAVSGLADHRLRVAGYAAESKWQRPGT